MRSIQVYPVPTLDRIRISFEAGSVTTATVELSDILARTRVKSSFVTSIGTNQIDLDLSELKSGLYFLRVSAGTEAPFLTRIVKQ